MVSTRFVISALAIASRAYAQCSVSATTTLEAAADATAISGCTTFSGSIAMASSVSGAVDFGGITKITGSLLAMNADNITSITANALQSIGQTFEVQSGTILTTLAFPALTSVKSLQWIVIGPYMQQPSFGALTTVKSLNIRDTFLQSLTGISLETADTIYIAQNNHLTSISMPLTSVSTMLTLQDNANGQSAASFPNLVTAGGIDIRNTSSLDLSALRNVTDAFSITGNTFTNLSLPAFTTSNGFAVDNNNYMTSLSAPKYTSTAGAFSVQNNTDLTGTITFPKLAQVAGAATILGSFSGLSLPSLNSVLGAMTIISTKVIASTCSHFDSITGANNVIQGVETCSPTASSSTSSSTGSSSSSSSSSSASTSSGGHYEVSQASAFTVFGLLAALFELMM